MNERRVRTGSVMIGVACVLFSLVLISIAMMSGLYAKYMSRGNGGDDARVAKFSVSASLDDGDDDSSENDITVDLSADAANGNYTVTVTNDSEVAVEYTIAVTISDSLPAGVGVKIGDVTATQSGNTYTFSSDAWALAPNGATATHTLTFEVTNHDTFTSGATGESYSSSFDFDVTCNFVQID